MANTITQTTLAGTADSNAGVLNVVSATGIGAPVSNFPQKIYVINQDSRRGELMTVVGVSGTQVQVTRLDGARQRLLGPSGNGGLGAVVLIAPPSAGDALFGGPYLGGFQEFNPVGGSMQPQDSAALQPWVNITTGEQWLYSALTLRWVPGWNNEAFRGVTAAVASAAGQVTPSGPLFHMTGALAVTGFSGLTGFTGGEIKIIPDGAFTYTATNNIGKAGTAVVGKTLTFTYDSNLGLLFPDYIA